MCINQAYAICQVISDIDILRCLLTCGLNEFLAPNSSIQLRLYANFISSDPIDNSRTWYFKMVVNYRDGWKSRAPEVIRAPVPHLSPFLLSFPHFSLSPAISTSLSLSLSLSFSLCSFISCSNRHVNRQLFVWPGFTKRKRYTVCFVAKLSALCYSFSSLPSAIFADGLWILFCHIC